MYRLYYGLIYIKLCEIYIYPLSISPSSLLVRTFPSLYLLLSGKLPIVCSLGLRTHFLYGVTRSVNLLRRSTPEDPWFQGSLVESPPWPRRKASCCWGKSGSLLMKRRRHSAGGSFAPVFPRQSRCFVTLV